MSAVPCNGCRTCCRDQLVPLLEEDEPNISHYDVVIHENNGLIVKALREKPNGECAHLGPAGCEIYEHRPIVCRSYDCRKQFKIMSRNERRGFTNSQIWKEARARLHTLDADDLATLQKYNGLASDGFKKMLRPVVRKNDAA